jgi:hypothetical protein
VFAGATLADVEEAARAISRLFAPPPIPPRVEHAR